MKQLARSLGSDFAMYVQDLSAICLDKLILDPYDDAVRKVAAKSVRWCIAAIRDHPD